MHPITRITALCALTLASVACKNEQSSSQHQHEQSQPQNQPSAAAQTYTSRGVVRSLPTDTARFIKIQHEAIPNFADAQGNKSTMQPMTMGFDVSDPAKAQGLQVGDKVEFTFAVSWTPPKMALTDIRKLPADTTLNLGAH